MTYRCYALNAPRKQPVTVGGRLAHARRRVGLSQARLAAEAGCSESYLSQVERDVRELNDLRIARRIAATVDIGLAELLGLETVNSTPPGRRPDEPCDACCSLPWDEGTDDVDRRALLTSAGKLAGGVLAGTVLNNLDPDDQDLLLATLSDPERHVGERVVGLIEQADAHAQRRTSPLPSGMRLQHAKEQLAIVRQLRPTVQRPDYQERLAVVEVQTARLLGRLIGYWRSDAPTADRLFRMALSAAHHTGPHAETLRAYTLGGLTFLHAELGDPGVAVRAATQALDVAAKSPIRTLPSWLHATSALAHARVGDRRAAREAMATATDQFVEPGDDDPVWMRGFLTPGLLAENRARTELRVGRPQEALGASEVAERLILARPGRIQQYAVLLAYRTEALVRDRQIAEACQTAIDALDIALPIGYGMVTEQVRNMWKGRLARHRHVPAVGELGEILRMTQIHSTG